MNPRRQDQSCMHGLSLRKGEDVKLQEQWKIWLCLKQPPTYMLQGILQRVGKSRMQACTEVQTFSDNVQESIMQAYSQLQVSTILLCLCALVATVSAQTGGGMAAGADTTASLCESFPDTVTASPLPGEHKLAPL